MNEACDTAVQLSEEDGQDVTIFITPLKDNNKTDEDSAGEEETNSGISHFSWGMLEAEAEIVVNKADNDVTNNKQKQKQKKRKKI